jgi:hypothetical protein
MNQPAIEFGPFPALSRRLSGLHAASADRVTAAGRVWAKVGEENGVYSDLEPLARKKPSGISLLDPRLGGWSTWTDNRVQGADRLVDDEDLQQLACECHSWVCSQVAAWVTPLFAPMWRELPTEITVVSGKSLAWTMCACALVKDGPTGLRRRSSNLDIMSGQKLAKGDPLGDFVLLHLLIERLVAYAGSRLRLEPIGMDESRRTGGLRTQSFLEFYPALAAPQAPGRVDDWRRMIDRLIDHSPVTRLVYADLVTRGQTIEDATLLADHDNSDFMPLMIAPQPAVPRFWRNLWLSHLARSLAAAMLSEPLVAGREPEQLYCLPLGLLAGLFRNVSHTESLDLETHGVRMLHMRFLDVFIRQIALEAEPEMREVYMRTKEKHGETLFLDAKAPLLTAFLRVVLGADDSELRARVLNRSDGAMQPLRDWLRLVFDAGYVPDADPGEMDKACGGVPNGAAMVIARFSNDENHGLEMAYAPPGKFSWSPQVLLHLWLMGTNILPASTSVTTVTPADEEEAVNL